MIYEPDRWVVMRVDDHHRVFGSWVGGFTGTDHWRLNSGIVRVEQSAEDVLFHGHSGSVYRCRVGCYGTLGAYNALALKGLLEELGQRAEVLDETDDWEALLCE